MRLRCPECSINPVCIAAVVLTDRFKEFAKALGMMNALLSKSARRVVLAALVGASFALTGCGTSDGIDPLAKYPERVGSIARYPLKGDAEPHPGVKEAKFFPVHGIDVSKWQGEINWDAVREANTRFVFIKATEGGDHLDEKFLDNWNGAKAAGVPRAAYHFVYWCRPAHEQAQWFIQHIPNDADALHPFWMSNGTVIPVPAHARSIRRRLAPRCA